jgi:hypothetical protein
MASVRRAAIAIAMATLPFASLGAAAGLANASKTLGANVAAVTRCDTDGVTIIPNLSGANVASVTVGSIASACGNAPISVNVNNATANSTGAGTVPAGGGSITLTLAVAVAAKDSEQIDVSILGP